ncbi:MAG: AraC family ligand binding domain-containing protein, partial [Myxococcales bacterium]|nr:AraC family ligand binding domain-containing protein [Myxococcales bacterium]
MLALEEGEALVWCRGETHLLVPGALLLIEPGNVHRDLRKTPYRAVMVMMDVGLVTGLGESGDLQFMGSPFVWCPALNAAALALVAAVRA